MSFLYHPLYQRYPKANQSDIAKISQTGIVGYCLEQAINEFISEEKKNINSDNTQKISHKYFSTPSIPSSSEIKSRIRDAFIGDLESQYFVLIDDEFKQVIMQAFHKAVIMTHWDDILLPPVSTNEGQTKPPAALLHGKLQSFNRVGKRWRISITDAKIRPRIDLEPNDRFKTLWDVSGNYIQDIHKRKINMNNKELEKTVKLDGEIILLAYDDI